MIGSGSGSTNLSDYLLNFNSSAWSNQANQQLQSSLNQGLGYSQNYMQQAVNADQAYNNTAQNQLNKGFQQSQALNAPQQLATYNALDAYQNSLGLATPQGGSFQLAQSMNNNAASNTPQQQQQVNGYNRGLLSNVPRVGP